MEQDRVRYLMKQSETTIKFCRPVIRQMAELVESFDGLPSGLWKADLWMWVQAMDLHLEDLKRYNEEN